ncbi:GNAT family N-acetyltransferase [Roseburia sp. 1XD42-69]|uniref:GNAT family N-acetyltransferase n=1 Tax=Roseburia sp. 1XD42-69 TaxID=2320088 RepID=UPI000EA0AAAE|nr:GNAT family protein [Roseburia sp. 1XD42-69]RKJ68109.1 N-acetyltransferase [Roseburia sp. 1XD42-69]
MIIQGSNIKLVPIDEHDTSNVIRWRNNVRDKFISRDLFTIESHTKWLNEVVKRGKAAQFIIETKQDGKVGSVFLKDIDKNNQKAEFGIFIGESSAWGKGYGSEAAKLIIQYGFERLQLHKIMLRVFSENSHAIRSYEKAGFVQEGYLKDEVFLDGRYYDVILMRIVRTDYVKKVKKEEK